MTLGLWAVVTSNTLQEKPEPCGWLVSQGENFVLARHG